MSDDEHHSSKIASMMGQLGMNAKYLKGGLGAWEWNLVEGNDTDISVNEFKKSLDSGRELLMT